MQEYRAFIIGLDGHIIGVEPIVCASDEEAIERARLLVKGHSVELWSGARLVILLPAGINGKMNNFAFAVLPCGGGYDPEHRSSRIRAPTQAGATACF
jgi:hypothetical protein